MSKESLKEKPIEAAKVEAAEPAKIEEPAKAVALDPALLDAINEAVVSAVAGSIKTIVEQVRGTVPASSAQRAPVPQVAPLHQAPQHSDRRLQGIPVEPGQDLRHVHPNVINEWFRKIELRAIERMKKAGQANGTQASMSWTRG